jgi:hypothetical protein
MPTLAYLTPQPPPFTPLHRAAALLLFFPALGAALLGTLTLCRLLANAPLALGWPVPFFLLLFAAAAATALLLLKRTPRTAAAIALLALSPALLLNLYLLLTLANAALFPDPRDPYPYEGLTEPAILFSLTFLYLTATLLTSLLLHHRSRLHPLDPPPPLPNLSPSHPPF